MAFQKLQEVIKYSKWQPPIGLREVRILEFLIALSSFFQSDLWQITIGLIRACMPDSHAFNVAIPFNMDSSCVHVNNGKSVNPDQLASSASQLIWMYTVFKKRIYNFEKKLLAQCAY